MFSEQLWRLWRGIAAFGYRECPSMIGETSRLHSLTPGLAIPATLALLNPGLLHGRISIRGPSLDVRLNFTRFRDVVFQRRHCLANIVGSGFDVIRRSSAHICVQPPSSLNLISTLSAPAPRTFGFEREVKWRSGRLAIPKSFRTRQRDGSVRTGAACVVRH